MAHLALLLSLASACDPALLDESEQAGAQAGDAQKDEPGHVASVTTGPGASLEQNSQAVTTTPVFNGKWGQLSARSGGIKLLMICMNANSWDSASHVAEYDQIVNFFWGNDGLPSVAGWFAQNSRNKMHLEWTATRGCTGNYYQAPRQGTWYWDTNNHARRWADAIEAADSEFDYKAFDRNGDNRITGDELVVVVIFPGNTNGFMRSTTAVVDGGKRMAFDVVDAFLTNSPEQRTHNVGLLAHEISHAAAKTVDLHSIPLTANTNMDLFSMMDNHRRATHLDPFHKLKLGWIAPDPAPVRPVANVMFSLPPVASGGTVKILWDSTRRNKEYFLLENRASGAPSIGTINYDDGLQEHMKGAVLWHIVEDTTAAWKYPLAGESTATWQTMGKGDGRTVVRFLKICGSDDPNDPDKNLFKPFPLRWANGDSVGSQIVCAGWDPNGNGNYKVGLERL